MLRDPGGIVGATTRSPPSCHVRQVRAVLGAAAALADTVLLLVLGVPYAVLWGLMSFLFSFIPNIGFVLALIPPTVFALLEHGPPQAIAVVVGYVVINLAFDYVLQPRVMATSLELSPVVTVVTIVLWTLLIGPAGALLAVPLTIALRATLQPYPGAAWFLALLGSAPPEPEPPEPVAIPVAHTIDA
jgi:predicted PurR-regulated permease PerM